MHQQNYHLGVNLPVKINHRGYCHEIGEFWAYGGHFEKWMPRREALKTSGDAGDAGDTGETR